MGKLRPVSVSDRFGLNVTLTTLKGPVAFGVACVVLPLRPPPASAKLAPVRDPTLLRNPVGCALEGDPKKFETLPPMIVVSAYSEDAATANSDKMEAKRAKRIADEPVVLEIDKVM